MTLNSARFGDNAGIQGLLQVGRFATDMRFG